MGHHQTDEQIHYGSSGGRREKEKEAEILFKEITAEDFLNLGRKCTSRSMNPTEFEYDESKVIYTQTLNNQIVKNQRQKSFFLAFLRQLSNKNITTDIHLRNMWKKFVNFVWKDGQEGPAVTREQSPAFLRNSNGRLDLPGPTQEAA